MKETERNENHELDATKQPPDLFTGTFQEDPTPSQPHEEADVYLSAPDPKFSQSTLQPHLKDDENVTSSSEPSNSDLTEASAQGTSLSLSRKYSYWHNFSVVAVLFASSLSKLGILCL